jgi:hypothetical protein
MRRQRLQGRPFEIQPLGEPAVTVWQIRIELAGRCASGRIGAHGRRWVYPYDRPLWIAHDDPEFVRFADE